MSARKKSGKSKCEALKQPQASPKIYSGRSGRTQILGRSSKEHRQPNRAGQPPPAQLAQKTLIQLHLKTIFDLTHSNLGPNFRDFSLQKSPGCSSIGKKKHYQIVLLRYDAGKIAPSEKSFFLSRFSREIAKGLGKISTHFKANLRVNTEALLFSAPELRACACGHQIIRHSDKRIVARNKIFQELLVSR